MSFLKEKNELRIFKWVSVNIFAFFDSKYLNISGFLLKIFKIQEQFPKIWKSTKKLEKLTQQIMQSSKIYIQNNTYLPVTRAFWLKTNHTV